MAVMVSVVIPVFNGKDTLNECLGSVLNQTYDNYEIIVVDNNSTDKTASIIRKFQKNDGRVKYIFEKERKRGAARNTGERNAKGEIILMTDSDCIAPKNWIMKMTKLIVQDGFDAVQGLEENVGKDFWSEQCHLRFMAKYGLLKQARGIEILGKVDTKNFAIKKDVLKSVGFTSRDYFSGNDTELSIKLSQKDFKMKFEKIKIRHFNPCSFFEVVKKQICRAEWVVYITKKNENYLKNTKFKEKSVQTFGSFMRFFPGLGGAFIKNGIKWGFFELVWGVSWRIGIILGKTKWLLN